MANHRNLNNSEFRELLDLISQKATGAPADFGLTAALIAEVDASSGEIGEGIADQIIKRSAAKASTTTLKGRRKTGDDLVSRIKQTMKLAGVPPQKFEELGLDADDASASTSQPVQPIELLVEGFSSGKNVLKFNKNGNKKTAVYLVEAKTGAANDFVIVGTTTKTTFNHTGQTPGTKVTYRVRAQRGDELSDYSNEATVYG